MAQIIVKVGSLSGAQKAEIETAITRARNMADQVWTEWTGIYNQTGNKKAKRRKRTGAWKSSDPFMEWFGWKALTNPQFNRVNRRLSRIRSTLHKPDEIKIIFKASKGWCCGSSAWNGGFRRRRLHICDGFFNFGAQEQATTIVHEMVHATAASQWGHPGGSSLDADACRTRASRTPRKARSNAYSFERLFMDFDPGA